MGGLGNAIGPGTIIPFWYTFFLTDIVQLNLGLISLFWVIVTTWDAINNPIAGYISDRTKSRWGRRRPYLLFGAIPFGVFFILLWWIPPFFNQTLLFLYYLVVYLLFESTASIVVCSYNALVPQLTQDHDQRTDLVMAQMIVTIAAGILVPILFGVLVLPLFPERDPVAYQLLAGVCGIIFILAYLITFFWTKEKVGFDQTETLTLKASVHAILNNRPFRYALGVYVFAWMPVIAVQAFFIYYFMYWVGMGANEVSVIQGVIMLSAWLFLPAVLWLSRRFEKKTAYMIAAGSWALIMLGTLIIPSGAKIAAYAICALSGFGIAAIHLMPASMLPDVIEVDELESGHRQEGLYTGVSTFVNKLGQMVILASLPAILSWSGYIQPTPDNPLPIQPDSALLIIRLVIAVLPCLFLVGSVFLAWRYPLTRAKHAEIKAVLLARKEQKDLF